jgi:NFU1 iron-sulfur cluster scaffold homolog, mitochondrial
MFVPGKPVLGDGDAQASAAGPVEFSSARAAAAGSPLARRLFGVDGVSAVFFGSDFITVTKTESASWATLKPDLFAAISDHYASGEPTLEAGGEGGEAGANANADTAPHPDDDEVVAMIKELLETRIRPAVREDGGDIVFRSWDPDTGTVTLKMAGACSGCPSSAVTLKSGIENMLMHYVPEVKEVVEVSSRVFVDL